MSNRELFTKNMLKISDVAEKLGVEGYVIFEKITYNSELLENHIHKMHSIRYIDEDGVLILKDIIDRDSNKSDLDLKHDINNNDEYEHNQENENKLESTNRLAVDIDIFSDEHDFLEKVRKIELECVELEKSIQNDRQTLIDLDKTIMRLEYEIRDVFQQKSLIFKSKENT